MITGTLPAISNRADWPDSHAFELYDDDDNSVIDLTTATALTLEIRDDCYSPRLVASLANGDLVLQGTDTFKPTWTASNLGCLCAGTYVVGCTAVVDGKTIQLIIGMLPVLEGIVR